jgi:hypothetical protein
MEHVQKHLDRRQANTSFYLSVNAAILAATGLLVKDSQLAKDWLWVSVLLLLMAGFLSTWIWRSLLNQYEILIGWWYARLREIETSLPEQERLITREYNELYGGGQPDNSKLISMTGRERTLTTIFMALYVIFALGVVWTLLR